MSVRYGMLAVLDHRSMYGYELRKELEGELGDEWSVNYGQVYSTLERLVRDGLVVQSDTVAVSDAPDRKLYALTPAGSAELRNWFLTPIAGSDTRRNELFAKIILGLTSMVAVEEIIQTQRKCELRRMGELTALKETRDPQLDLAEVLQLDMFILRTEATIRWLDLAEARIRKAALQGPSSVLVREASTPKTGATPDASAEAPAPAVSPAGDTLPGRTSAALGKGDNAR